MRLFFKVPAGRTAMKNENLTRPAPNRSIYRILFANSLMQYYNPVVALALVFRSGMKLISSLLYHVLRNHRFLEETEILSLQLRSCLHHNEVYYSNAMFVALH